MFGPETEVTPEAATPPIHVADKVQILLVVVLLSLGLLFVVALVISLLAAVVQLLSFLLPPSTASPTSVSIYIV